MNQVDLEVTFRTREAKSPWAGPHSTRKFPIGYATQMNQTATQIHVHFSARNRALHSVVLRMSAIISCGSESLGDETRVDLEPESRNGDSAILVILRNSSTSDYDIENGPMVSERLRPTPAPPPPPLQHPHACRTRELKREVISDHMLGNKIQQHAASIATTGIGLKCLFL